jgi:hypothetical protein
MIVLAVFLCGHIHNVHYAITALHSAALPHHAYRCFTLRPYRPLEPLVPEKPAAVISCHSHGRQSAQQACTPLCGSAGHLHWAAIAGC